MCSPLKTEQQALIKNEQFAKLHSAYTPIFFERKTLLALAVNLDPDLRAQIKGWPSVSRLLKLVAKSEIDFPKTPSQSSWYLAHGFEANFSDSIKTRYQAYILAPTISKLYINTSNNAESTTIFRYITALINDDVTGAKAIISKGLEQGLQLPGGLIL